MEFENSVSSSRPRPWLLIALGLAVVLFVANWMWPTSSATPQVPASNQARTAQPRRDRTTVDPADLSVRLDALSAERPGAEAVERNPFRFQPKAPPPPPPGRCEADAGDESGAAARTGRAAPAADSVEVHRDRREARPEGRGVERLPVDAAVRRRGGDHRRALPADSNWRRVHRDRARRRSGADDGPSGRVPCTLTARALNHVLL